MNLEDFTPEMLHRRIDRLENEIEYYRQELKAQIEQTNFWMSRVRVEYNSTCALVKRRANRE
jgi:hypothetical protein